jgi:hypothetical protein
MVYDLLAQDPTIMKEPGVTVDLIHHRQVIASTAKGGIGNVRIDVSQRRTGKFQWNAGGLAGQHSKTVRIEFFARTVKEEGGSPNARDLIDALKQHVEEVLFSQIWLGLGWLGATQTDGGYPSTPLGRVAYNYLQYDFLMSMGY